MPKKIEMLSMLKRAMEIRTWEKLNFPIQQSSIALETIILIAYHTINEKPLTLKALFCNIESSEAGVRKHLKRFVALGWCTLEGSQNDKRLRIIVAQPIMLNIVTEYVDLQKIVNQ